MNNNNLRFAHWQFSAEGGGGIGWGKKQTETEEKNKIQPETYKKSINKMKEKEREKEFAPTLRYATLRKYTFFLPATLIAIAVCIPFISCTVQAVSD